jgi:hypothetical protein
MDVPPRIWTLKKQNRAIRRSCQVEEVLERILENQPANSAEDSLRNDQQNEDESINAKPQDIHALSRLN